MKQTGVSSKQLSSAKLSNAQQKFEKLKQLPGYQLPEQQPESQQQSAQKTQTQQQPEPISKPEAQKQPQQKLADQRQSEQNPETKAQLEAKAEAQQQPGAKPDKLPEQEPEEQQKKTIQVGHRKFTVPKRVSNPECTADSQSLGTNSRSLRSSRGFNTNTGATASGPGTKPSSETGNQFGGRKRQSTDTTPDSPKTPSEHAMRTIVLVQIFIWVHPSRYLCISSSSLRADSRLRSSVLCRDR